MDQGRLSMKSGSRMCVGCGQVIMYLLGEVATHVTSQKQGKKVQLLQKSCKVFSVIGAFGLRWEWRAASCLLLLDSFTFPTSALALGSASQTLNFKPVKAPTIPACLLSAAELWPNHILRTCFQPDSVWKTRHWVQLAHLCICFFCKSVYTHQLSKFLNPGTWFV